MQGKTETSFQTFNDGVCSIWKVDNVAEKGNMPRKGLTAAEARVPYERRKVGILRSYNARQENVEIEMLLRIPGAISVSTQDVCSIEGRYYGIYQVQDVPGVMPPAKDVSLKKLEEEYDGAGI